MLCGSAAGEGASFVQGGQTVGHEDQSYTFPQLSVPEIGTFPLSTEEDEELRNVAETVLTLSQDDDVLNNTVQGCLRSVFNTDLPKIIGTSYLLHSDKYQETMSLVPANFGCTLQCGEVDPSVFLISKTMFEKKERFEEMLSLRKRVVDYCFLNDFTLPKMLVLFCV